MNPNIVAGLINRVYSDFNMFDFDNRLKLQKFVYFLEYGFDLNIGYEFEWYTYGPYCVDLTIDGFQIEDFSSIRQIKFLDSRAEAQFKKFLEFFKPKKNDSLWLEIASSIHLLKKLNPERSDKDIVREVQNKHDYFKDKEREIRSVLEEMKKKGLIK